MISMRFLTAVFVTCALFAIAPPADAHAQDPAAPAAVPEPARDTELVFDREIFQYPSFTRRNPFRPLEGAAGGVRYEQLTLIGIMYSPDASASVAVVSTGGVAVADDGTTTAIEGDSFYLKPGETIGNTTIIEIRRDAVIVDVEVFDAVERVTMNFVSRRPGGTS